MTQVNSNQHAVRVISLSLVTHDVLRIVTDKPAGFNFIPGQATELAINREGWQQEGRAFTFTSLPGDPFLEFTIKVYPSRNGVTRELLNLAKGDELIVRDIFGDIRYQDEGVFIAGGAGITPFISIFKDLEARNLVGNNRLIFANKTRADIIDEHNWRRLLGVNFISILSEENAEGHAHGFITGAFLQKSIPDISSSPFYLCGPPPMMEVVENHLAALGVDDKRIIKEAF